MAEHVQSKFHEIISQSAGSYKHTDHDVIKFDKLKSLTALAEHPIKLNEKFITKDVKNLKKEAKEACKVLHYQSEWTFEEVLTELGTLNPKEYPNLFIFIFEVTKFTFEVEKVLKVHENLLKFSISRPFVLQLTSEDEDVTKFYYKEENSTKFSSIDREMKNFEELKNFPSFLCSFLSGNLGNPSDYELDMINILPQLNNSALILRFLQTLNLSDEFYGSMILKVSKNGSKSDFLAALDAPFDCDGRLLSTRAQNYLSDIFYEDQSDNESDNESEQSEASNSDPEDEDQEDSASCTSSNSHLSPSVMLTAVEHKNKEVIDYLITYWTHLIQQLPFRHQIRISTAALESSQLDVLCDLLEISDFPFPEKIQVESIEHEKLRRLTAERIQFSSSIKDENFEQINEFISNNLNLKLIYNPENKSTLKQALNLKKYNIYFYLKSFGLKASEFDSLEEVLKEKELKQAIQAKIQQRRKNVNEALTDDYKAVNLLCSRSSIHNKRVNKEQHVEYRRKIRNWFKDIKKIKFGSEFLDVAASCDKLKIIFDFESDTVENASLSGPHSLGSTYPISKWIFIGAKLSDKKREQRIKGVLAHELCHYVMRLVYENQENPYYKHMLKIAQMFDEIVNAIDKWSTEGAECPDDECNGIISSVFKLYSKDEFHLELIVRVVQILVEFDDDEDKIKYLQDKFKILFDFWEQQVITDLKIFNLKDREVVRKINRLFELLPSIKSEKIKFSKSKDIKAVTESKFTIVTSNVPKLLLINIQEHLQLELGDLFDTKNIFVDPEKLKNQEILSDFRKLLNENLKLRIIVDCSKEVPQDLDQFDVNEETVLIFVVKNENDRENLEKKLRNFEENPKKFEIHYNWADLTEESQILILQTKVNFQNNSKISIIDLMKKEINLEVEDQTEDILDNFSAIIDEKLINFLVEKSEIKINQQIEEESDEKNFKILFKSRNLIKNFKLNTKESGLVHDQRNKSDQFLGESSSRTSKEDPNNPNSNETDNFEEVTQQQMLEDIKNKKFVIISDKAGSGKSWILKNFANLLKQNYPNRWVTYVDLKQYIAEFKAQRINPEFSSFFIDKILKRKFNFETKLFKNFYKNGKISILFDGFDEIAPDCAEFVSNLAQTFDYNDGNQLWIATRDYFEVDLKAKLKLDTVYKLTEFTEQDGVDLIVSSWMLSDWKGKNEKANINDIKKSENYDRYMEYAKVSSKWIFNLKSQPIGLPQFFKMIAEVFYSIKDTTIRLTILSVYSKFVWIQYERWAYKKGELRKNESISQHQKSMNYHQLHQLIAMQSLFPKNTKFCDLDVEKLDWSDERIVACGMLIKKGEKFFFFHETFREYFAAEFIIRILTNGDVDEDFCEYLISFISIDKFRIIRLFLNKFLSEDSTWRKIDSKIPKIAEILCKNRENVKYLSTVSEENLDNLADFLIVVMKTGNYEDVKIILNQNRFFLLSAVNSSDLFIKIQDFIISYLNVTDLRDFVLKNDILHNSFGSDLDINTIERFLDNLSAKTGLKFIKNTLKLDDKNQKNLLFSLIKSQSLNAQRCAGIFKILTKFLTPKEILELTKGENYFCRNILHECVDKEWNDKLKIVWTELKQQFGTKSSMHFKDILLENYKIFIDSLNRNNMQTYATFWELIFDTFEDRNVVKLMIMAKNTDNNNFIHLTLNKSDKIELTFTKFKEYFNKDQFTEILLAKGHQEANVLLLAAKNVKLVENFKFLWNIFREIFKSDDEFKKFLMQVDCIRYNIFHYVVKYSNVDIFEFIINQFELFLNHEEIRQSLNSTKVSFNLLETVTEHNMSLDLHKSLWKIIEKYFDKPEILKMITHSNIIGENLFFSVVIHNDPEVVEFTWNQIKKYICTKEDQRKYLRKRGFLFTTLKFQINSLMDSKPKAYDWYNNLIKEYDL